MKLLNCLDCDDIVLIMRTWRSCGCLKSRAKYLENDVCVEYTGNAPILGMLNSEYDRSLEEKNYKTNYVWFVIDPDNLILFKRD